MDTSLLGGLAQRRGVLDISHLRLRTKRCEMKHRREVEFLNLSREMKQGLIQKVKAFYSLRSHRSLSMAQVLLADAMSSSMSLNRLSSNGRKALQEWGRWTRWKKGGTAKVHHNSSRRKMRQIAEVLQEWSRFTEGRSALAKMHQDVDAAKEETERVLEAMQDMERVKAELEQRNSDCVELKVELDRVKKELEARAIEELELQAEKFRLKEAMIRSEMELRAAVKSLQDVEADHKAWKENTAALELVEDKISAESTRERAERSGSSGSSEAVDEELTRAMSAVEERRAVVEFWKETRKGDQGELKRSELNYKESGCAGDEKAEVRRSFEDLQEEVNGRMAEVESLRVVVEMLKGREKSLEQRVKEMDEENTVMMELKSKELRAMKTDLEAMEKELIVVVTRSEAGEVARITAEKAAAAERQGHNRLEELHELLGAAKAISEAEAKAREKAEMEVGVEATRRMQVEEALQVVTENAELRMAVTSQFEKRFCKAAARRRKGVVRNISFQAWRDLSEARKERKAIAKAEAAAEKEELLAWAIDCFTQHARQQKAERDRNLKVLTSRSLQRKREQEDAALFRRRLASQTLLSDLPNLTTHFDLHSRFPPDENEYPHNQPTLRVPLTTKFLNIWSDSGAGSMRTMAKSTGLSGSEGELNARPNNTRTIEREAAMRGAGTHELERGLRFELDDAVGRAAELEEASAIGKQEAVEQGNAQLAEQEQELRELREKAARLARLVGKQAREGEARRAEPRPCEAAGGRARTAQALRGVMQAWRRVTGERERESCARVLVWVRVSERAAGGREREESEMWEAAAGSLRAWWGGARECALRRTLASYALQQAVSLTPSHVLHVWDAWTKQRTWARTALAPWSREHVMRRRLGEVGDVAMETKGCES